MTDIAHLIYTGIRYCRRKILIESTGDPEVDAALKEMYLCDYHHLGRGANELWRPRCKTVMAWMTKHDAETDAKREQKKRDKYPLLDTAKGGD